MEVPDIAAVGALMKSLRYRTFGAYVTRMRDLHIKHGFFWSQAHL